MRETVGWKEALGEIDERTVGWKEALPSSDVWISPFSADDLSVCHNIAVYLALTFISIYL